MVSDKIYNRQNDTVEKKITLKSVVNTFLGGPDSYMARYSKIVYKSFGHGIAGAQMTQAKSWSGSGLIQLFRALLGPLRAR